MLSLGEDILPTAPGVRAPTTPRRASHLSSNPLVQDPLVRDSYLAPHHGSRSLRPPPSERVGHPYDPVSWTPKNPRLAQLAEQIRQLHYRGCPPPPRCPSGLHELDAALGGGFALAAVHELVAAEAGAPAWRVALCTAAHAAAGNKWIFYIDTRQELYPPGVAQLGVPLGRLLVIRTPRPADALWVGEQVLRCRAVAAIVLPVRTIDAYASRRLQLAAEAGGSLGLIIRDDQRGGHTFAASRLRLEPLVGPAGIRRMRVTVLKLRDGRPREPFVVELPDAADSVPAHAIPADRAGPARRCVGD